MPARTVLIADKHALFRRSLRQVCEINGGFRVVAEAASAAELLALAAHWRPDAVVAAMQLVEGAGAATTRLLLAAPARANHGAAGRCLGGRHARTGASFGGAGVASQGLCGGGAVCRAADR